MKSILRFTILPTILLLCLLLPAARAQSGCPSGPCVSVETWIVYDGASGTMDAITITASDYGTAAWYDLCTDLEILRLQPGSGSIGSATPVYQVPPACTTGLSYVEQSGSVPAWGGYVYAAQGTGQITIDFTYYQEVGSCDPYCGDWYDVYGYSLLGTSNPTNIGGPSYGYGYPLDPGLEPFSTQVVLIDVVIDDAFAPPAPRIMFNGTNIAGQTDPPVTVVVGQQIALTAQIINDVGDMITPASSSWTRPDGTIVGGYAINVVNNIPQKAAVVMLGPTGAACQTFAEQCLTFYWVDQGSQRALTYAYTLEDGSAQSATATFNVTGPTATGAQNAYFKVSVGAVTVDPPATAQDGTKNLPYLEFGNRANPGITFDVTASPPAGNSGAYQWVQLITSGGRRLLENTNPPVGTFSLGTGLDNWYPYAVPAGGPEQAVDYPGVTLALASGVALGEVAETFGARMYLMWDPALPVGCVPASTVGVGTTITTNPTTTCSSTPVPLGYMDWGWVGDSINTLTTQTGVNGTTWLPLPCGAPSPGVPMFQTTTMYPTWNNVVINN